MENLKELLQKKIVTPQKTVKRYSWQITALDVIQWFGHKKKSSIFKEVKNNQSLARIQLAYCKEKHIKEIDYWFKLMSNGTRYEQRTRKN